MPESAGIEVLIADTAIVITSNGNLSIVIVFPG